MPTEDGPWPGVSDPTVGGHIEIPLRLDYPFISSQFLPYYCLGFVCLFVFKGNTYWMGIVRIKFTLSELLLAHVYNCPPLVFPEMQSPPPRCPRHAPRHRG